MKTDRSLPHHNELAGMDAEDLLLQVQRRMSDAQPDSAVAFHVGGDSDLKDAGYGQDAPGVRDLTRRLRRLHLQLETRVRELGKFPPTPSTPRARIGHFLIAVLRRLIWWHTRSIQRFAAVASRQSAEEVLVLERLAREQQRIALSVEQLQRGLAGVEERLERLISRMEQPRGGA